MWSSRLYVVLGSGYLCLVSTLGDLNAQECSSIWKRHSAMDSLVAIICQSVEKPSSYSLEIASGLIGIWKPAAPVPSDGRPGTKVESIEFRRDGIVRYSVRSTNSGDEEMYVKTALYEIFHRGSAQRDLPSTLEPNLIIKDTAASDSVIALTNLYVGLDNRFPLQWGTLLRFRDLNGSEFFFVRDKEKMEELGYGDLIDFVPGIDTTANIDASRGRGKARQSDPKASKEILQGLSRGYLSDYEKNKMIVQLINVGDSTCVPLLIELCSNSGNPLVIRQNSIRALGRIADRSAILPLIKMLEQPVIGDVLDETEGEAILRRKIVEALGEIGDETALPMLRMIARSDREYRSVREFADVAIQKIEMER